MDIQRYQITLHSPMGPKRGSIELYGAGEEGRAVVTLIGYQSELKAQRLPSGQCRLRGALNSVMGAIQFETELNPSGGRFDGLAYTSKGVMRLTGEEFERNGEATDGNESQAEHLG